MLEIKLIGIVEYEIDVVAKVAVSSEDPYLRAHCLLKIIQLSASKGLANTGISKVKVDLVKERNLAACNYFFRNCMAEAEWRELIYFAKNALACMLESGSIEQKWLEEMLR